MNEHKERTSRKAVRWCAPFASVGTHKDRIRHYLRKNVFISLQSGHRNHLDATKLIHMVSFALSLSLRGIGANLAIAYIYTHARICRTHTRFVILNCFDLLLSYFPSRERATHFAHMNFSVTQRCHHPLGSASNSENAEGVNLFTIAQKQPTFDLF